MTRKTKNLSIPMFKINGHILSSTLQLLDDQTKDKENIYIYSYLIYKNKRIYTFSNRYRCEIIQNEEPENKIKELMKKNKSITIKEISKQTGFSKYIIGRFYMKLRRNLNGRIK